jgi:hypothetical protein
MGLKLIFGCLIYIIWIVFFVSYRLKLRKTKLKYLFEPRVNKLASCASGARYDAVHAAGFKNIIGGAILFPIRVILVFICLILAFILVRVHCLVVG